MEVQNPTCLRHSRLNEIYCKTCNHFICAECISDHDSDGHESDYVHVLKYIPEKTLPVVEALIGSSKERERIAESESVEIVASLQDRLPKLLEIVEAHSRRVLELKGIISKLKGFSSGKTKAAYLEKILQGINADKQRLEKAIKTQNAEETLKLSLKTEAEEALAKSQQPVKALVEELKKGMEKIEAEGGYDQSLAQVAKMLAKCNSLRMVQYINDWKCDRTYFGSKMYLSEDGLTFGNTASSGYPAIIGTVPFDSALYAYEVVPTSLECSGSEGFGVVEKDKYLAAYSRDSNTPEVYNDMIGFFYSNIAKNMKVIRMGSMQMGQKYYVKVNMMEHTMIIFGPEVLLKTELKEGTTYYPCFSCGCSSNRIQIRPLATYDEVEDPTDTWT